MSESLNRLIAQGGTGVKSPMERYMEGRSQAQGEQMNRLSMQNTQQTMQDSQEDRRNKKAAGWLYAYENATDEAQRQSILQEATSMSGESPEQLKARAYQGGYKPKEIDKPKGDYFQALDPSDPSAKPLPAREVNGVIYDTSGVRQPTWIKSPSAKAETNITNIIGEGESELSKALNKEFGKDIITRRNDAIQAKDSLIATNDAIDLLDSGIITGTGAEYITSAGKVLRRIGVDYFEDDVKNTEAYYANQAKQVAQVIKAFGSGTGLSDADREYAEKAAAGKITMSEGSLRKIIGMNQSASKRVIQDFNKDVRKLKEGVSPFDLSIEVPSMKSPVKTKNEWSIEAL